ncbi:MAG: hypothetical protein KBD94_07865 [Pyrinomonadaceae bacterium]|nr:hypothetical protein [Pyrinomonadaceae bacterium]
MALCIVHFALCIFGCGAPSLESTVCSAARDAGKRFYSFHFANDMRLTDEGLKARQRFLTPRYFEMLSAADAGDLDPFTMTREYPRTFKIGECREASPTDVDLQVQLYWRDDEKTVQQEVVANLVKQGDEWLLDGVGSKAR